MAVPAIPPIRLGSEFSLPKLDETVGTTGAGESAGGGFGAMLAKQLDSLSSLQVDASQQSQALATGKADDVSSVAMSVERASLGLELASTVRNKAVEAYQEIFRMQV
jgi:flagellar hook-basal body complex protein FliE